jgi:hypothetical protein
MQRTSISGLSISSRRSKSRVNNLRHTIRSQLNDPTPQDFFWWSATDGGAVIADAAPTKKQAIADIGDEFRLGAVQRLQLAKYHAIEMHGWRIALQRPEESCDDFLDRSCGQIMTDARPLPFAHRRPRQQINSTQARP